MKRTHQSSISSFFNQRSEKTSPNPNNSARSLEQANEKDHELSGMNTEILIFVFSIMT